MMIPEHPEIELALRTGYPSWMQEDDDDGYEDDYYEEDLDEDE